MITEELNFPKIFKVRFTDMNGIKKLNTSQSKIWCWYLDSTLLLKKTIHFYDDYKKCYFSLK